MSPTKPTAVLVHGAFADASGYAGVVRILAAAGYPVLAPPNQLRGVANDASQVRDVAAAVGGPVVLVGHSYGGAVITQAAEGLTNLNGLVYLAAFAPDVGESVASLQAGFPAPLLAQTAQPTPYDAVGAGGGPELYIAQDRFRETFAGDSPEDVAALMAVSQRPLAAAATEERLTYAGWAHHPTWYLVSGADRAIAPELERSVARRMGAVTEEIANGSHTAFVAQPDRASALIRKPSTPDPAAPWTVLPRLRGPPLGCRSTSWTVSAKPVMTRVENSRLCVTALGRDSVSAFVNQ